MRFHSLIAVAALLAFRPELKPAGIVALIKSNADPLQGQAGRWIINPKRTLASVGVVR